ncbi:MAG: MAE_28990/MAE_18760 family HEPN-like nuclease, partial [Crocosphaera sp.]|nr:MAE_28990/MAE_18760 family HEPN-like nuclease [Crocosphaera sp.]
MEREEVLEDFNKRSQEVSDYFAFLREVEQQQVKVVKDGNISNINTGLDKTLKATGYLLLYNLVESTMRNAIELIFDQIQTNNISFDNLKIEFKELIWK